MLYLLRGDQCGSVIPLAIKKTKSALNYIYMIDSSNPHIQTQ